MLLAVNTGQRRLIMENKVIMTGLKDLDAFTGGLRGGQLVVVAGRPGM